jgi:hypothetical protein
VVDDSRVIEDLVAGALAIPEASLVIHRRRTLVEFKTDLLRGALERYEEHGHVSWQVGDFHGHHCHLDLRAVRRVVFEAAPSGCQGGRTNFTVWFLDDGGAGNPNRPDGYFSVTLNSPYEEDGALRLDLVEQMIALYLAHDATSVVDASPGFRDVVRSAYPGHAITPRS